LFVVVYSMLKGVTVQGTGSTREFAVQFSIHFTATACFSLAMAQPTPEATHLTRNPPTAAVNPDLAQVAGDRRGTRRPTLISDAYSIYVSPNGDDQRTGRHPTRNGHGNDGPLHTIGAAQAKARIVIASMASGQVPPRAVHVLLEPGTYRLSVPLTFDERDSGKPGYPVGYAAVIPGTVLISGGIALRAADVKDSKVVFQLPSATKVDWRAAQQLFVDGRRETLARQPNVGRYWFVQQTEQMAGDSSKVASLFATSGDALAWVTALSEEDRRTAVVNLYQAWTTGRHRLMVAPEPGHIAIAPAPRWPFLRFGRSQRFFVENVAAALDASGEWFGRADTLTYVPHPHQRGRIINAVLPVLDKLIIIGGSSATGAMVENLELRGLNFEHTRYLTPVSGYTDNQAASAIGAAIEIDRARGIVIDDCQLRHVGMYGIWLRDQVRNTTVSNNILTDLGAGGIRVGMTNQGPDDQTQSGSNTLSGNVITNTGRILPGAVGIWLGQTWDNRVERNLIANTSYTGISVGWQWGYGGATSGRNSIESNVLLNIGQGEMSDMGGIYLLGESPGTVIRGNLIREVRAYAEYGPDGRKGGWGIYEDEGTSDTVVEDNVVVGTDSGGYHLHYGRRNSVRGNVFAGGDQAEVRVTKTDPTETSLSLAGNVLIPGTTEPFYSSATAPHVRFERNVVAATAGLSRAPVDITKCGKGCDARPLRLVAGPFAKSVDVEGAAGPMPDAWRRALVNAGPSISALYTVKVVGGSMRSAQVAPTESIHIDIAGTAIGARPSGLNYRPKNDALAIYVVEDQTAPAGNRCLRFDDSSRFSQRFEPFAFATLGRTEGRWESRFSLWIDERAEIIHEWRDDTRPYKAGPSMVVTANGVVVDKNVIALVRPRTWTTFTVSAPLRPDAGKWSLEIQERSGPVRRVEGLPLRSAEWNELRWVGFVSNATSDSTACFGEMVVDGPAR
jgi:hypothetical protein